MRTENTTEKNTVNKVLSYCRKHTMFQPGDKVVLGVSGGADSICLLFVLQELKVLLNISLYVVHVNHGVRRDAAEDGTYVQELCRQYDIPFYLEEVDMNRLAKEMGVSSEEAGRIARYGAFERACEMYGCNKIAVAHNSNDRAETMLFHLFRGTGLKGMAGILPVRDNIVRPLLCLERSEIEAYLLDKSIHYKQDSTNDTDDYTRNRIRHHILPYAQQYIAEASVANMCRAGDIFAREEAYLEQQTYAAMKSCVISGLLGSEKVKEEQTKHERKSAGEIFADKASGVYELSVEAFLAQHPVIRRRLVHEVLKKLTPLQQNITAGHVEDILTLFEREGNRQIHLPYGIRGRRSYNRVLLERPAEAVVNLQQQSAHTIPLAALDAGEEHSILLADGSKISLHVLENPENTAEMQVFSQKQYTKWLDYDKIIKSVQVRTRQTGDYLTIHGKDVMQHKRLKDYMITEKIPASERDRIPVLAEEDHIIWLVGFRISEYYKVTTNTKRVLKVQLIQCDEGTL